jgi:hypothetical protein
MKYAAWCLSIFLTACLPKSPIQKVCTEEARAALTVFVKDGKSNLPLADSVVVKAVDGTYTETLQFFQGNPSSFSGAWERPGNYNVIVERRGYKPSTNNPVVCGKDECHVIPQTLTVSISTD